MAKYVNLAKGRTYVVSTNVDTTVTMGTITIDIEAPQGLFVATSEIASVANDSASVRQILYSASAAGIGQQKPLKLQAGDSVDPANTTEAVSGAQVAKTIKDELGIKFSTKVVDSIPNVADADINTIYLVATSGKKYASDSYDEYMKIEQADGSYKMEFIGTTVIHIEDSISPTGEDAVSGKAVASYTFNKQLDKWYNSGEGAGNYSFSSYYAPVSVAALVEYASSRINSCYAPLRTSALFNELRPASDSSALHLRYATLNPFTTTYYLTVYRQIRNSASGGTETVNNIGYKSYKGDLKPGNIVEDCSFAIEDVKYIQDFGFISEDATDIEFGGANNYIDSRVRAALDARTINVLSEAQAQQVLAGTRYLAEHDIMKLTGNGTAIDLTNVVCNGAAVTAEIWIDMITDTTVTWPDTATTAWIEGGSPASLATGKRHVIVMRNDGPAGSATTHQLMNYAYSYVLP